MSIEIQQTYQLKFSYKKYLMNTSLLNFCTIGINVTRINSHVIAYKHLFARNSGGKEVDSVSLNQTKNTNIFPKYNTNMLVLWELLANNVFRIVNIP